MPPSPTRVCRGSAHSHPAPQGKAGVGAEAKRTMPDGRLWVGHSSVGWGLAKPSVGLGGLGHYPSAFLRLKRRVPLRANATYKGGATRPTCYACTVGLPGAAHR